MLQRPARRERPEGGDARCSERGGASRAVDELGPELPLELTHLRADAGLADVHPLRGPGEVGLLGHGDEVLELAQFHDC